MKLLDLFESSNNFELKHLLLEFNVANIEDIEATVDRYLSKLTQPEAKSWFKKQVQRFLINSAADNAEMPVGSLSQKEIEPWLKKAIERGDIIYKFRLSPDTKEHLDHIVDWLNGQTEAAVEHRMQTQFARVQEPERSNIQKNLLLDLKRFKEKLFKMTVPQAIEASKEWTKSLMKRASSKEDEAGIIEYINFPDGYRWVQLTTSGCLDREGKLMSHCVGSYANQVSTGGTKIFSLRDPKNDPHITVEVRSNKISQIKGKGNKPPEPKYISYVQDFLNKINLKVDQHDLSRMGLIYVDNALYNIFKLPDNLVVSYNLDLRSSLEYSKLENFIFPKNLTVNGTLILPYLMTSIGPGLTAKNLHADGCKNLQKLPDDIQVISTLDISETGISTIPKTLLKLDYLIAKNSKLKHLIDNLKIKKILDLDNTLVEQLPENITVGDALYLRNVKLQSFPKRYKIGKIVGFDSNISKLDSIPDNTTYNRLRFNEDSTINKIGDNVKVLQYMLIKSDSIKELPTTLDTNILEISNKSIKMIPNSSKINDLILADSAVEKIGENMIFKNIDIISNEHVLEIPESTEIVEQIVIHRSIQNKKQIDLIKKSKFADKLVVI